MSFPDPQSIITRWLQNYPVAPTQPLSPTERQAIMAVIDMLRANPGYRPTLTQPGTQPGPQDLQSRVVQLDRYILEQLLPALSPTQEGSGSERAPAPPQPDGRTPDGRTPDGRTPDGAADGKGGYVPLPHNEVLLLLLNYLNQLLHPTMWTDPQAQKANPQPREKHDKPTRNDRRAERRPETVPVPKGPTLAPREAHAHPKHHPSVKVLDSAGLLSQLTNRAAILLNGLGTLPKPTPKSIQDRAEAQGPTVQAAPSGKLGQNADEWIFRLMGIQAAASNMAAMNSDMSAASSAQMAVAMSKLFTQFAKLQNMIAGQVGSDLSANDTALQQILATAKTRIQAYLETLTGILKNPGSNPSVHLPLGQMESSLQRTLQEEAWLSSLVAFVESRGAQKKPQAAGQAPLSGKAVSEASQQTKNTSTTTPLLSKDALAHNKNNPIGIPRDPGVAALKEAAEFAAAHKGEAAQAGLQQLLQPRSTPELFGMIQAHLAKHPLAPANILIPYPMSLQLDDPIADVEAMEKHRNDPKRPGGQKITSFGDANSQVMCLVPAGPVIVGDPFKEGREDERPCHTEQLAAFLLAATPVTNAQYAAFLNQQMDSKAILMPRPGYVYDLEGRLLALTFEAAPLSQIELVVEHGELYFRPQRYHENNPVVHVSWWGAKAFCDYHGLVLPTEAQWERGGGMAPTVRGQPIQKLRYGCAAQELTLAWANFHIHGKPPKENRTSPVAFFDGQRVLTHKGQRIETIRAVSPWGCFDMSGNVREWVAEDYDEAGVFHVTKGGSYADRPFDLRLAARLPLPAESTDPYTGFRTAFAIPVLD